MQFMEKAHCDICEKTLERNYTKDRWCIDARIKGKDVALSVMAGVDGLNTGDVCLACVFNLLLAAYTKELGVPIERHFTGFEKWNVALRPEIDGNVGE